MIHKEIITNNNEDVLIPFTATQPQIGFIPKEESLGIQAKEYDAVTPIANGKKSVGSTLDNSFINHIASAYDTIPINSTASPTDYVGVMQVDVPYLVKNQFALLTLYNAITNNPSVLGTQQLQDNLKTTLQVDIKTLLNGVQMFTFPANSLIQILTDEDEILNNFGEVEKKLYGKHYVTLSPKYIDTEIITITERIHKEWLSVTGTENRRKYYEINNIPFADSDWNFEPILTGYLDQGGRLLGSVVEVLNAAKTIVKQTKIITESNLYLSTGTSGFLTLSPDHIGYDSVLNVPVVGDIFRVYPRETYFNPITFEIDFQNPARNLELLLQFISNDAVRDLQNNVIEIYDDNGISTDEQGNLNGQVTQRFQVSIENNKEIRRRL